jgi:hypothetical protein
MHEQPPLNHPLIPPIYEQSEPSQAIDLGTTLGKWISGTMTYQGQFSVRLQFAPDTRLQFTTTSPPHDADLPGCIPDSACEGNLVLVDRTTEFEALRVTVSDESMILAPRRSLITATAPTKELKHAVFHLLNFPDFSGAQDYRIERDGAAGVSGGWCGRVILQADGWTVTIAATDKSRGLCERLKEQGGFLITHMGRIERTDGATFSSEDLQTCLGCLQRFLSFALGRRAGVALPVGFDAIGKRVFEEWGTYLPARGSWNSSLSWFDRRHGTLLSEVYPGFVARWNKPLWQRTLSTAVYWYVHANSVGEGFGNDAGLILAQTALEHLAWTYCVLDRKMVSKEAFEPGGLRAYDKLRLLLSSLGVPADLPPNFRTPPSKNAQKLKDIPDAVTFTRNKIVHPPQKSDAPTGDSFKAWKLALWVLDLVLLRLCDHQGNYHDRREASCEGNVQKVPWAESVTSSDSRMK